MRTPFGRAIRASAVNVPCTLWRQTKPSRYHTGPFKYLKHLQSCRDLSIIALTHGCILKSGHLNDTVRANHLANSYIRLRRIELATRLFDEMLDPNVVSWTSLMAGYNSIGRPDMALELYRRMHTVPVTQNEFTLATSVNACSVLAVLETGRMIHAHVEVLGLKDNLVVSSALVDMYGKCNCTDEARRVFNAMGCRRNVVSWTSMISAYVQNGQGNEALELFEEYMRMSSLHSLNHYMLTSVIGACASLGRLTLGKAAHGAVIRMRADSSDVVASALVDMYAKCGCFGYSNGVFRRIQSPSVITYTSIIVGTANLGLGKLALELLEEMAVRNLKPNSVTFVGILHACSHAGLVDEGIECLNSMHQKHGVQPDTRHYTCVVDMLGRTGRIDEAYRLAKSVKVTRPEEGALLWGTLLSASKLHGRIDIAAEAGGWLISAQQQVAGAYVAISNIYLSAGDMTSADSIRAQMKMAGIRKEPGCSWVTIRDTEHVFYAGNLNFPTSGEVASLLKEMELTIRRHRTGFTHSGTDTDGGYAEATNRQTPGIQNFSLSVK